MTFKSNLKDFTQLLLRTEQRIVKQATGEVLESIQDGSPLTGSPGQPVDTGTLRASWQETYESPTDSIVSTNMSYARVIEDDLRSSYDPKGESARKEQEEGGSTIRRKSTVGGHHSVKLTANGFDKILRKVVREVTKT